jgi:hypothetical protein
MTVAVDLGSAAVKIADGADASVLLTHPVDSELAARVGTTVPMIRRDNGLVVTQAPHDAYVRAVATALDGMEAESAAIVAPDWWSKRARELVERSLETHASGPFRLVSPAVAATSASRDRRRLPTTVAVLDIGAESSSTTVLTEVEGVHRVVGRPAVLHGWAGNEIDRRLLHHVLGWLSVDGHGYEPFDAENASAGRSLLAQVRAAKERLSTRPAATLTPDLPGANAELRLVRSEFDEVVRGTIDAIVTMLKANVATNAPDGAGAVLLIGGSVSIPLVTQVISVDVGLPVILDDDPATLAVRGAAATEMPAAPKRKRRRRRHGKAGAPRNVFDLNHAPAPDTEPHLDATPIPAPEPDPGPSAKVKAADHDVEADPDPEVPEVAPDQGPSVRLGGFIEASRRDAAATSPEAAPPEPAHLVIDTEDASPKGRTAHWTSEPEGSGWDSARRVYVDDEGQFLLRVNDRDHEVEMGAELASTSVTVLLIGLHVFITLSETGELLRELRLNPERDFRPE